MAFEFITLTKEEKEEINSWNIKIPYCSLGQTIGEWDIINPDICAADKDRKIYLFGAYYEPLRKENNLAFAFFWKEKSYFVQFTRAFEDSHHFSWNIPNRYMNKDLVFPYCSEEGFIDDLRDALIAYGPGREGAIEAGIITKCGF
ncbi:MAG: hypothetical protein K6C99_01675 [Lachnospiraceae bacterium]|nr:hypothetical protein [Lachnospiraceae bacterium]